MGVFMFVVFQTSDGLLSYSFGQLLYEMTMCRPLNAALMDTTPSDMAAAIRKWIPFITYVKWLSPQDL